MPEQMPSARFGMRFFHWEGTKQGLAKCARELTPPTPSNVSFALLSFSQWTWGRGRARCTSTHPDSRAAPEWSERLTSPILWLGRSRLPSSWMSTSSAKRCSAFLPGSVSWLCMCQRRSRRSLRRPARNLSPLANHRTWHRAATFLFAKTRLGPQEVCGVRYTCLTSSHPRAVGSRRRKRSLGSRSLEHCHGPAVHLPYARQCTRHLHSASGSGHSGLCVCMLLYGTSSASDASLPINWLVDTRHP